MSGAWIGVERLFDGKAMHGRRYIRLEDGCIAKVRAKVPGSADVPVRPGLLAPGFIDVQVNGGDGVLFNDQPTVAGIDAIARFHRRHGTTGLVPTLISSDRDTMGRAVEAVTHALQRVPGVVGIHLEGPYLNPQRRGIHPAAAIRRPDQAEIESLALPDGGVTVMTLAPECVPAGTIEQLTTRGVRVCIGHTMADHDQTVAALQAGACGFTHLFNAMTPLTSREPGAVGAALAGPDSWCGIIVDGIHVHPETLRIALAAKAPERMMLVSDAVHAAGSDQATLDLLGTPIHHRDGRVEADDGTLAGSDLTLDAAVRNAVELLGIEVEEALRMASLYPATFLGVDQERGRILPGYRADLVLLDDELKVQGTWVGGQASDDCH